MGDSLEERLWQRLDPDGSLRSMSDAARTLADHWVARGLLRVLGVDQATLVELGAIAAETQAHLEAIRRVVELFSTWGWAPSGLVPTDPFVRALRSVDAAEPRDRVEGILLEGWRAGMLQYLPHRIASLGHDDDEYNARFQARAQLVRLAWEDHVDGRWHASVPVVAAQIEGLCYDVSAKPFFSKRTGVEPVDDATLAGLHEGLPVARDWFSADVPETVLDAEPSRHGVLHGRSLGYHTELVSTKYFVLLAAVWEWAQPLAAAEGMRRRADRQARHAGSDDVDDDGRRRDDREFQQTREALRTIYFAQLGWLNQGAFRGDLTEPLAGGMAFAKLPTGHGIVLEIASDGGAWYAWRRTVSGWVLGLGGTQARDEWVWDSRNPPASGPPGANWIDGSTGSPSNWR